MPLITESKTIKITVPMVLDSQLMYNKFDNFHIDDRAETTTIIGNAEYAGSYYNSLKNVVGEMRKRNPSNNFLNRLNSELAQIVNSR